MRIAVFMGLAFGLLGLTLPSVAATKKVVFLAGKKSHGPGDHEYEKACRLLAHCLETSSNARGFRTEVHLYGWPEDPKTLDNADCIVVYSDGADHNEADHPLLVGDRMSIIQKQMKRGCGLVLLHYSTITPVKRTEFLDWVGGHFDYETGTSPNHWASAIKFCDSNPAPATPAHPICRGVSQFALREEYYHKIKLRASERGFAPILSVAIPGEFHAQTVAWALQRKDGGRGFATTCGHPYTNFLDGNFRRVLLNAIVWAAKGEVPREGVISTVQSDYNDIRALILTGQAHPAHDWRATTAALKDALGKDSRMKVTVWEDPEKLATDELFKYDLIIQNYQNWERPTLSTASRANLLKFVREGKGLVLIHFADGSWRDWPDYAGRLSRRVWIDGKSNHDPFGAFRVHVAKRDHLLTSGISDFDTRDELYYDQQGELPIEPLLTARSKLTNRDEPLAYVYNEGKGRIFQTFLGHASESVSAPGTAEIIRRASAWVANREVLPLPVADTATPAVAKSEQITRDRSDAGLDPRNKQINAEGKMIYQEPPLTVEVRAKLYDRSAFNILAANSLKDSPKHWELYTTAGSGTFQVYLPGISPTNIDSKVDVVDGKWHVVAMTFLPDRIKLYVDGKQVADQAVGAPHFTPVVGPLWFGCYPPQGLSCDGIIAAVRLSNSIRSPSDLSDLSDQRVQPDQYTIGLWRFDGLVDGGYMDLSSTKNPARNRNYAAAVDPTPRSFASIPKIDQKTSLDWANVGNDKGGMRYSTSTQINRDNVKDLKPVWEFHGNDAAQFGSTLECTPIVVDGVMYLTTVKLRVVALDASNGNPIWEFNAHANGVNRGVAYWSDGKPNGKRRILVSFSNSKLYSLDAKSGIPDPQFGENGIVDLRKGLDSDISRFSYGSSSAPAVFQDLAILGFISSEVGPGAPGDIRAFDVRTGKQAWIFHTVPRPNEFGYDTWPPNAWKDRGGANPWGGLTVDAKTGIVFCGTGSAASDFYGADRIGANLFANCTIALDARTGKRIWHFQSLHHDLWDRDIPCPPVVVTVNHNGRLVEAVAQPTKTGYCFLFERKTGKPLFPIEERPVPSSEIPGEQASPTQPVPLKPPSFAKQEFSEEDVTNIYPKSHDLVLRKLLEYKHGAGYNPPSLQGSVIIPGFHGGATWSGASFDPTSGLLYVNSNNTPWVATLVKDSSFGYNFTGYNYFNDDNGYPAVKPPWGLLTAIDLNKGEFAWQVPLGEFAELKAKGFPQTGTENFGGTIATAGGLVFIGGAKDEKLHAFDKSTGKLLWEYGLPAGGYATPCTYMVNGRQYVVIACGGGGKLNTKSGDSYVAFALP